MPSIERHNLEQIELLNQRGGRTLSVVDLMEGGTLSPELVGFILCAMAQGASVLMGAGPSGTGKSTLLANALCMLPPGERIITTKSDSVIQRAAERAPSEPECYLAHEIGAGRWYGYIWGRVVRDFFRLMETGRRIASCLHADTLEEAEAILQRPPLFVDPELINLLGLVGFVQMVDVSPPKRRLVHLYSRAPGVGLLLAFRWRASDDAYEMVADPQRFAIDSARLELATDFARSLADEGVYMFEDVRARVVEFYQREGW